MSRSASRRRPARSSRPFAPTEPEPSLPIPGRKPFSKRRRQGFLLVIIVALVAVVVVAIVAATSSSPPPARPLTISKRATGTRPLALKRAARAVGFTPATLAGVGTIEDAAGRSRPSRPPGPDLLRGGQRRRRRSR